MKLSEVRRLSKEDLLGMMGLEPRREVGDWLLPTIGLFAAGMAVGAVLGMAFAPKPGRELRDDVRHRLHATRERVATRIEDMSPVQ